MGIGGRRKWDAVTEVLVSPGLQDRVRALVVIPITMVILLAVLLVSAYISESPGGEVTREGGRTGHLFPDWLCQLPIPFLSLSLSRKGDQGARE